MSAPSPWYSLGAFKTALTVGRCVPRPIARIIGGAVARLDISARENPRREAMRHTLAHITGLDGPPLERLLRDNFLHCGHMMSDYFQSSVAGRGFIDGMLEEWRGWENLTAARERGKGGILVTAHLGNWELGAMLLAIRDVQMTIVTLEEPTSELSRWREDYRRRLGIRTITVGTDKFAFVEMIAALRRNEFVAMLVDRPSAGSGIDVPFFGETSSFSTGPALLWQHTDAAVLPAFVVEAASGRYLSFIDPPVPFEKTADSQADILLNTGRIANVFEAIIRAHPEQWYNYVPLFTA